MDAAYTANPRFDPQRNAAELGLRSIPVFFLGGSSAAGASDATATERPDYAKAIPWTRLAIFAGVLLLLWKLAR